MKKYIFLFGVLALLLSGCQKQSEINVKDKASYQTLLIEKIKDNKGTGTVVIKDPKLIQKIFKEVKGLHGQALPAKKLISLMREQETISLSFSKSKTILNKKHPDYTLVLLKDGRLIFPDTSQKPIKLTYITKKIHPTAIKNIKEWVKKPSE